MNFTSIVTKLMSIFVTPKANKVPTQDSTLELLAEEVPVEEVVESKEVFVEEPVPTEEKPVKAKKTTKKVTQKVIK